MPELSDLLHRSVDDVDVPRPHVHDITAQGRALRIRRRLGGAVAAAVVLGAIGGGFVLADPLGGDPHSEIAKAPKDTGTPYDEWSAWSLDDDVTIGGRPVRLPGQTVNLAQTSVGVVAKTFPGDDDPARYVLVRPDGSTRTLSLPASVPTVDGDIAAPRIAWVSSGRDVLVLHVWDVERDEEPGPRRRALAGDDAALGRRDPRAGAARRRRGVPPDARRGLPPRGLGHRRGADPAAAGHVGALGSGDRRRQTRARRTW
nr:hypothetical protein [Nocardioides convexus]